jgi:hypothetical protein
MTALVVILVASIAFVATSAFYHLDRLIRAEHDFHHDAWLADGRPFFIGLRERIGIGSQFAWMRVSWVWPFRTPTWARSSADHMRRLRLLRIFVLACSLPIILFLLFALALAYLSH